MESERLSKLKDIALGCNNCSLGSTRTKLVFGEGNPKAIIMFTGEAPGREENQSGRPFVGRSGQLLRKMIRAIKLDPEKDCYIANICKCRPPNNRPPELEEINQCIKFLNKQIEIIKPSIIVLLGKTAVKGFFPDLSEDSVGFIRDKFNKGPGETFLGARILMTYHPSALLRSPQWHAKALEDFYLIESEYAKKKEEREFERKTLEGEDIWGDPL